MFFLKTVMAQQETQQVVCLSIMLSVCVVAGKNPSITLIDDQPCFDGNLCDSGSFCFGNCEPCSPCPDYHKPHLVIDNKLNVMKSCVEQGFCPNICRESQLRPKDRANETLCYLFPLSECYLSCENGSPNRDACKCLCSGGWSGDSCTDCNLNCLNGGTKDDVACQCSCDQNWTGNNCTDCGLSSCLNGGTVDAKCQCSCDQHWTGNTCSECGLTSCLNGGRLNTEECQCLCSGDWTGTECSEPGSVRTTASDEVDDTAYSVPAYKYVVPLLVVLLAGCGIYVLKNNLWCRKRSHSSSADAEKGLLCIVVEHSTPNSMSIQVKKRRSKKMMRSKMRLSCRKADIQSDLGEKLSVAEKWGNSGVLHHIFTGLCPGVSYKISVQQLDKVRWIDVQSIEASTPYSSLSVEVNEDGFSVTVKGLLEHRCKKVDVCRCLNLSDDNKWINVQPDEDNLQLSPVLCGLEYAVKAGTIDNGIPAVFRCIAECKLLIPESSEIQMGSADCSTTFRDICNNPELRRSLQVELNWERNYPLPEVIASALELTGDDYKRVKNAQNDQHLDNLLDILESQERLDTSIHSFIEAVNCNLLKEAEDFIWKVVRFTCKNRHCMMCLRLLHQSHQHQTYQS